MEVYLLHNHHREMDLLSQKMGIASGDSPPVDKDDLLLIQWDGFSSMSLQPGQLILNATPAIKQTMETKTRHAILHLNGIPLVNPEQKQKVQIKRQYYILMFQFDPVAVYRYLQQTALRAGIGRDRPSFEGELLVKREAYSSEIKRGIRLSVRTIYALGLDFAGVWLGVRNNGKLCVIGVDPTPKCTLEEKKKYVAKFVRYSQEVLSMPKGVTIGTDIEFLLQNKQGQLVPASNYLSYHGRAGYDALRHPERRVEHPIVELRPSHSRDPLQLYRNLYAAMKLAKRRIGSETAWLVGNSPIPPFCTGGHLHFGHAPYNFQVIRVLDEYLALPFRLLEDPRGVKRRPRYGRLGDVRKKVYGYEYRTLPSFIYTPKVTVGVLSVAKFLVENYLKFPVYETFLRSVQEYYYKGNGAELYALVIEKLARIESAEGYDHVRRYCAPLFQQIREGRPWDEQKDIRPAWRL